MTLDSRRSTTEQTQKRPFWLILISQSLNALADALANAKTILPWIMQSVGAPTFLTGLLVPIRESGSMLPQVLMGHSIQRMAKRKVAYALGMVIQGLCVAVIAVVASTLESVLAGITILGLVALLALARAVCSICSKDLIGKSIAKGQRGKLLGLSSSIAGAIALVTGGLIMANIITARSDLNYLLLVATAAWFAAAYTIMWLVESPSEPTEQKDTSTHLAKSIELFKTDTTFKRFVMVRALLMGSGLSAPYLVLLSQPSALIAQQSGAPINAPINETINAVVTLGALIALAGLASLISASIWGRMADSNSKLTMQITGGLTTILCVLAALAAVYFDSNTWLMLGLFFMLNVTHQGVRLARKTYVADIAEGNLRTQYVATSNSAIGALLLVIGLLSAVIAQWSIAIVLALFGLMAAYAIVVSRSLPTHT